MLKKYFKNSPSTILDCSETDELEEELCEDGDFDDFIETQAPLNVFNRTSPNQIQLEPLIKSSFKRPETPPPDGL